MHLIVLNPMWFVSKLCTGKNQYEQYSSWEPEWSKSKVGDKEILAVYFDIIVCLALSFCELGVSK